MASATGSVTVEVQRREVAYWEIHGRLEFKPVRPAGHDVVVLSNIERGAECSPGAQALSIRYVARGCENYRIAGRGFRVEAGQVMIAPHQSGAAAEARKTERSGTLGLCTLINMAADEMAWAQSPLVMAADSSAVGALLHDNALSLWKANGGKTEIADRLIAELRAQIPRISGTVLKHAGAVSAAKPATRFELVRRAYLAQAYLHSTTDRAVNLEELATAIGTSAFRLLTAFNQCFDETPASYHRKLRLNLAVAEAQRRQVPIATVADEFGFAGGSSFSHAYRRAFGRAPVYRRAAG
jgi:AraC-like DNA-binding protein